jgi:PBP1b-binding outer membrane lipoprotein LpoB
MNTKISELKLSNQALQGTRNPAKLYDRYANNQSIKTLDKQQKRAIRDSEAVQKGKLTSTQKKVIVGAVGVSAIIAAGAYIRDSSLVRLTRRRFVVRHFFEGKKYRSM